MNKINKIGLIVIVGILIAGVANAYLAEYWKTIDDIIPRTDSTSSIGSSTKEVLKIWTEDLTASGTGTFGDVGIGIATPEYKLEVLDTATQLTLTNVDDTSYAEFFVDGDGDLHIEPSGGNVAFTNYIFPLGDGTTGQYLKTDGAGNLSWATSAGAGDMTKAVYDTNSNNVVDTATALFANGGNCGAGSSPLGVDASGAVESCFDVWTEAENTSAGYISATLTEEEVEDFVGGMLGGTETNISVTYQDATNDIDFVVTDAWWDALTDMVLTDNYIYVGNASNDPVGVAMSNDCTIASNGAITCDHDALNNFVANEHLDWTGDLGAVNIHTGNYPITDTEVPNTITIDLATLATTLTITDNEATNETNAILFTSGGALTGGNLGIESDGTLNYNPSTGALTTTTFIGALTGNSSTATAFAGNPSGSCGAGEYGLGIDANGDMESCTDATTEINSVVNGLGGTNLTCATQTCNVDDAFLKLGGDVASAGLYDFGGATIELPQNGTTDSVGEIQWDTTSEQLKIYGTAQRVFVADKEICFVLEDPVAADDNIPFYFPRRAVTITDVYCQVDGGTSIQLIISDGTNVLETITCDADGAEDDGSIANGTFTALERMEFDLGTVSGTNTFLNVCVTYNITSD